MSLLTETDSLTRQRRTVCRAALCRLWADARRVAQVPGKPHGACLLMRAAVTRVAVTACDALPPLSIRSVLLRRRSAMAGVPRRSRPAAAICYRPALS